MSRRRIRLFALALSTLAVLAVAEVAARARLGGDFAFGAHTGPPQALAGRFDPDLGWALRGGQTFTVQGEGFRYRVETNSRGLRDREHGYEKAPSSLRILLLGDSCAWGWGADQTQIFAELVEQRLAPKVEVVNLAVPGYSTDQELFLLQREGAAYRADLVLLAFVLNDIVGNDNPRIHDMAKPRWVRAEDGSWREEGRPVRPPSGEVARELRHLQRSLARYSALAKLLDQRPPRHVRVPLDDPGTPAALRGQLDRIVDPAWPTHMLLARMKLASERIGAPLVAFVIPHQHDRYLYDPSARRTETEPWDGAGEFTTYATRRLAEAGRKLGFETVSIDAALLAETAQGVSLDCGDEHLNARGHEIVAEVLARYLAPWAERTHPPE